MSNINTCKDNCNKECFYKKKAEKYRDIVEDLQKDLLGSDFMDPVQDELSKYSYDPVIYAYMMNNKYIKDYIKSIKRENKVLVGLIVVLIIFIITNLF